MSKLKILLISLLFTPMLSHATVFDFSYVFQSGYGDDRGIGPTTVKGSFNGEQDGLYVTDLSDVQVRIEGRDFSSNLISILPGDASQQGKVSFDLALNNFYFVDTDYATTGTTTNYFLILNNNGDLLRQASNDNGGYSYGFDDNSLSNESWKLTAREVPEPSALLLLVLGLIPVVLKRRSFRISKNIKS